MAVMNKRQYEIVKAMLAMGAPPAKFAKMIKVDMLEMSKVQNSATYEQYADDDTPSEDYGKAFNDLFGFGKF